MTSLPGRRKRKPPPIFGEPSTEPSALKTNICGKSCSQNYTVRIRTDRRRRAQAARPGPRETPEATPSRSLPMRIRDQSYQNSRPQSRQVTCGIFSLPGAPASWRVTMGKLRRRCEHRQSQGQRMAQYPAHLKSALLGQKRKMGRERAICARQTQRDEKAVSARCRGEFATLPS